MSSGTHHPKNLCSLIGDDVPLEDQIEAIQQEINFFTYLYKTTSPISRPAIQEHLNQLEAHLKEAQLLKLIQQDKDA
jgi:hypothetical protein